MIILKYLMNVEVKKVLDEINVSNILETKP